MISTHPQYLLAFSITHAAHEGQFRRDNETPYVNHPIEVSKRVSDEGLEAMCVALLHDVIEDNEKYSAARLLEMGVLPIIVDAVVAMTKVKGKDYFKDYLPRVKANKLAKIVKIADIITNLSDDPTDKQLWKYSNALVYLLRKENTYNSIPEASFAYTDGSGEYNNRQPQPVQQGIYD